MSLFSSIKRAWQVRFGQEDERVLYRVFNDKSVTRWCEIGIGDGERALRIIKLLKNAGKSTELYFCGIDPFEARAAFKQPAGLQLKEAHRIFKETGIKTQLIPGDPFSALSRSANSINDLQIVIISEDQLGESLDRGDVLSAAYACSQKPASLSPTAIPRRLPRDYPRRTRRQGERE